MAVEAVAMLYSTPKAIRLHDVMFKSALTISTADEGTEVMLDLKPHITSSKSSSSNWFRFDIVSFDPHGKTIENCHGLVSLEEGPATAIRSLPEHQSLHELQKSTTRSQNPSSYYRHLAQAGLEYGEEFRLINQDIESGDGFALAQMVFKPSAVINAPSDACLLHPTILDASFHVIFAAIETQLGRPLDDAFVPTFIRSMTVSGLLDIRKHNVKDQHFWVRSGAKLPGPRVAHSSISIQSDLSSDVLVELEGFEITALGNQTSPADEDKRSLFFRLDWQRAFLHLADDPKALNEMSLSELVYSYCHQFPDAKILHFTSGTESTRLLLSKLGGRVGCRRRFRSVTTVAQSTEEQQRVEQDLSTFIPELYDQTSPTAETFDLVVMTDTKASGRVEDFIKNVKDGGFIICDSCHPEFPENTTFRVFDADRMSVWRKGIVSANPRKFASQDISVVLSPKTSKKTEALVEALQHTVAPTKLNLFDINDIEKGVKTTDNIVSLISLDEDLFFEHSVAEGQRFEATKKLLATSSSNKSIVWVTSGSILDAPRPEQAIVTGMIRTARNENENMRLISLDVPLNFDPTRTGMQSIPRLLDQSFHEEEVAERDGYLLIPRVVNDDRLNEKLPNGGHRQPKLEPFKQDRALALKIGRVGLLDTLQFEDDEDITGELGDDDVEVEVTASALNFRDIAASVGIIDDYRLGDECAGTVVSTGINVKRDDFKQGDTVICWRPGQGSHRRYVRNPAAFCVKTGNIDHAVAATMLGVTTTAYYALVDVARLQPGEYCLVHAAAGGVGQMAVQIAQLLGAKVIATCGAQAKRDYLKDKFGLPDEMIFSSRDTTFVEGVFRVTGGRGCDVVLNSLAGELLHSTWSCVAPFGRFVEIGKRDIHENTKLAMDPFRKNIAYASVDLITIYNLNVSLGARVIRDSFKLLEQGKIQPAGPIERVSYAEIQKGFRLLQMGKFFGKVVMIPGEKDLVPVMPPIYKQDLLFHAEKVYLLVGGLGGLGRSLSEWMLRKGARKIAFLSRSGASRPNAKATVQWLEARGVAVTVYKADAASLEQVSIVVNSIGSKLGGIFQAAMVLRDTPLAQMSIEEWRSCVYPKVRGTYNLHIATLRQKLDFFFCFSSGSSVIGAMGQANYAAANAYLDSLMRHRWEQGLPAFTMNVGRVGGIGVVAENEALEKVMDRIGYEAISEQELFYQIEEAVACQATSSKIPNDKHCGVERHQLITGINLNKPDVFWATRSMFRNLYCNHDFKENGTARTSKSLPIRLRAESDQQRRTGILLEAFIERIASVLVVPATTIQAENPLSLYGLDSIVAVEFRKWFSKSVGVELALFDILSAKSIVSLVNKVSDLITVGEPNVANSRETSRAVEVTSNAVAERSVIDLDGQTDEFLAVRRPDHIPQSTFQTRMWYLHNIVQDQSSLNFSVTSYLKGRPKPEILQKSLQLLMQHNDILRTAYLEGDHYAEQIVTDGLSTLIENLDFSTYAHPEDALQEYVKHTTSIPLDIEAGQVIRMSMVKTAEASISLILVTHHIALDSGSAMSATTQFTQFYDALLQGKPQAVSTPKLSYVDFTLWHREKLQSPELAGHLQWWKDVFSNAPTANRLLPFAKAARPVRATRERTTIRETLSASSLKRLKRVCSRMDVTPFQFTLATLRGFIYRYTREEDLTILMIDGSRPHAVFQDVLGFFVNMVPLRMNSDCDVSFDKMLESARSTALNALSHAEVPFDAIVDATVSRSQRSSSFPLGQIALNYQIFGNTPKFSTSDFEIYNVQTEDIPTACDLALEVLESPEGLKLRLEYDSYLYGSDDMERFMENFAVFFSNAIKDCRQAVEEVGMCGSKELEYLRENCWAGEVCPNDWNDDSVWDKVSAAASLTPEATAIRTTEGKEVTYAALMAVIERLALVLQEAGAKPGHFIGILAESSVNTIAAMMAATRLSCAYVPLDPDFAGGRLQHMIQDSSVSILLTDRSLVARANELVDGRNVTIRSLSTECKTSQSLHPTATASSDVFYVIYTSVSHHAIALEEHLGLIICFSQGSTGKPKGVSLTQQNTQAMLSSHNTIHGIGSSDCVLFHSSISFDLSVAQIWSALTAGGTVALASKEVSKQPAKLAEFMKVADVTISYIPATQFALLLEHGSRHLSACKKLRTACFAGKSGNRSKAFLRWFSNIFYS